MAQPCPYAEAGKPCDMGKRHKHIYHPKAPAVQRCTCGSRNWTLTVGGPMPVHVTCDRCSRENRTGTAFERGRFAGFPANSDKVNF